MACLFCKNFQAFEPAEHKKQREARQCQPHCGDRWNFHTAIMLYKEHPEYRETLAGWCHLYPQEMKRSANYVCAQINVPEYLHKNWNIPRRDEPDYRYFSLYDWAGAALAALYNKTWEQRQREDLELRYKGLQRQLENVQKISASRLARLQLQRKPKPRQEKPKQEESKPLPETIACLVTAE